METDLRKISKTLAAEQPPTTEKLVKEKFFRFTEAATIQFSDGNNKNFKWIDWFSEHAVHFSYFTTVLQCL